MGVIMGEVLLGAEGRYGGAVLEIIRRECLSARRVWLTEDGKMLRVRLSPAAAERLMAKCLEMNIPIELLGKRGLGYIFQKNRHRWGLWIGLVAAVALVIWSSGLVWEIDIVGNRAYTEEQICRLLAEQGLSLGTPLSRLDVDKTVQQVLLADSNIGWLAINLRGTTAHVEVVEAVRGSPDSDSPADLVATREGVIESIESYDGSVVVKVGDTVRAGELLVSGVYDTPGGLRTTRAEGHIFARTVEEFLVEIPLVSEKKVYTGRTWCQKTIKIFSKAIKVFTNTGKMDGTCDIIEYNDELCLPGGAVLPLGMETVEYREYAVEQVTLTEEQAMEKAYRELSHRLEAFVTETDARLLEKNLCFELDEGGYRLLCRITCIMDIVRVRELTIN